MKDLNFGERFSTLDFTHDNIVCAKQGKKFAIYTGDLAGLFLHGATVYGCLKKGNRLVPEFDIEGGDWGRYMDPVEARKIALDGDICLGRYKTALKFMGGNTVQALEAVGALD